MPSWWLWAACTAAPRPAIEPPEASSETVEPIPPDACVDQAPFEHGFTGVLAKARCQAEIQVIMQDVAGALGVGCGHCHQTTDYALMTHNKRIANWMASELASSLRKRDDGGEVWCSDCHRSSGTGVAKILGDPRDESRALEWMTAHLTATLERASGDALYCSTCHEETWGRPGFVRHVIPFETRGNGVSAEPLVRHDGSIEAGAETKAEVEMGTETEGSADAQGDSDLPNAAPATNDKN